MSDSFTYQTVIRCTQQALWDGLTKAEALSQHSFGCDSAKGHAKEGGELTLHLADGSMICRLSVVSIDAPNRMEVTFQPILFGKPIEQSTLIQSIRAEGDTCLLTIHQKDIVAQLEPLQEAAMRFASSLKSWLETGVPIRLGI